MGGRRSRVAAVVAAVVLSLVVAGFAVAVNVRLTDPDDTVGALDIRQVKFAQPKGEPPAWSVITAGSWKVGALWDRGYVFVQLDTKWSEAADYYALIRSDGLALRGQLFRVATKDGTRDSAIAPLKVWRKASDSVSVRIPLKLMTFGPTRTFYRWWVVTSLTSDKCPATCLDRAPDEGSVQQWRPGMSPTPSPTVTPTPTPSPSPSASPTSTVAPNAG